jgi:anhydro-N-acetylmuramic acid kinase
MLLNQNLQKLFDVAQKTDRFGIGLMSGTSLDGLDIALCHFTGNGFNTQCRLLQFITIPYQDSFKTEVRSVFAKREVDLEKVCLLNAFIGTYHAQLVLQALQLWHIEPYEVDFIASHGQTIYHAPKRLHEQDLYPNATLQIGDGDHLAVKTGILTISDFRQKHIAAGGEGAPLALYGDALLAGKPGENRVLLNIGGIANLTFLPADSNYAKIVCTDIGPGNTLIDAATQQYFNQPYDKDAAIAASGRLNDKLLQQLLIHPFFKESAPKTTGPELFNLTYVQQAQQISGTSGIAPNDLIATLTALTAQGITDFIKTHFAFDGLKIFVSGGGASNPLIIDQLTKALPGVSLNNTRALGIDPDAKEAILFALLGNEAIVGQPLDIGNNPAVLMGKFNFPA